MSEALRGAAAAGDLAAVDALIAGGVPVNAARADGTTALHLAVLGGYLAVAKRLVAAGADVRAKVVPPGLTALHFAARGHRTDIVSVLVGAGAELDARSTLGSTPLHVASRNGGLATIDLLIERGAAVDAADNERMTALHMAILVRRADVVERLLAHGAPIEARDVTGATPLHIAVLVRDERLMEVLLSRGANVNARNVAGATPLHSAAVVGHSAIVRLLLARGADVEARKDGLLPLAFSDNAAVFEILRAVTVTRKVSSLVPGLPRRVMEDVVTAHAHVFRKCHDEVLRQHPNTFGTVVVQCRVAADGHVARARESAAQSSVHEPALVACAVQAFTQLRFPAPIGGAWETTFPLKFEQREGLPTNNEGPAA